jgi:hypothetical protein
LALNNTHSLIGTHGVFKFEKQVTLHGMIKKKYSERFWHVETHKVNRMQIQFRKCHGTKRKMRNPHAVVKLNKIQVDVTLPDTEC